MSRASTERRSRFVRIAARALFAVLLSTSIVAASPRKWPAPTGDISDTSIAEARARYSAGNRAVEAGRWADALVDFERSYALSGVPAALFNLATTLRALGRHVDARDAFDQLLASHPDQNPTERERAKSLRQEEQARIATLVLLDLPPGDASVILDGKRSEDAGARPLEIEVDPGKHEVRVEQPKMKTFSWRGDFADADKRTVRVKLELEPTSGVAANQSSSIFKSPIFWTVVGVAVVGGGTAWWMLKGRDQRLDPGSSNVVHP